MSITLSPEVEARIRNLVEHSDYGDPESVVNEALTILEERDKLVRLRALIAVGIEQSERGQVVPWTPDFMDRVKQEAKEHVRQGKPFKDEVIP